MNSIEDSTRLIQKRFGEGKFDKFIHDVTFPNFKKIKPQTRIEFRFPLTVLVGANGGGKSSILQALWGAPLGFSTNRFWFATQIDPIVDEAAGKPNIPRYWYTHFVKGLNERVQTRKVKGTKNNGYWEPSRPATNDGMAKMPKRTNVNKAFMSDSGDRWTPVKREPHYINTKTESSAFDRFFYHTELANLKAKQDFFIWRSERLHSAIQKNLLSLNIGRGKFEVTQVEVSPANLAVINRILGKKYKSAKKVVHNFFDANKSPSVIFETEAHTYSESFAGSGELAVVNLVLRVEALANFDLLLIDEPETSLHPGAQKALLRYLLQITSEKYLQIVIATHSPTIVDLLPESALVVLEETPEGTTVNPSATKSTAFYRLGQPDPNKVTIVTEDRLLQAYVERTKDYLPEEMRGRIVVKAAVTGASEMLSHQVPAYMNAGNARVFIVLDGDQNAFMNLIAINPDNLSPNDIQTFVTNLQTQCKVTIVGSKPDVVAYIKWCKANVLAIEEICPEQILLSLLDPGNSTTTFSNQQYKTKVVSALKYRGDESDPQSQYVIFKSKLRDADRSSDQLSVAIIQRLKSFAKQIETAVNSK